MVVFCDNQAVVHMINKTTLSCGNCIHLLRMIVLDNVMNNRHLFAKYVKSLENILADMLSRQQIKWFWNNAPPTMERCPSKLPEEIWPMSRIWQKL